jgi:hypothetical protein
MESNPYVVKYNNPQNPAIGGINLKDFVSANYDGSSLTQGALPNAVPNDEGGLFGLSNKTWGTGLAAADTVLGLASYLDNIRKSDEEIKASKEKRNIMKKDFAATEAYRKSYA